MEYVNALGLVCPRPVVMAKKALKENDEITIDVDNEMSCENLQKMAKVMALDCAVSQEGKVYRLVLKKTENTVSENAGSQATPVKETAALPESYIVVINSQFAGSGDDELGAVLMKNFIYTLTEAEVLPDTILFYNGGVKLTCEGSPVLEDIKVLEKAGVELLSCGVCLNFYGLEKSLAAGQVTNMYNIVEKQQKAVRIIRP